MFLPRPALIGFVTGVIVSAPCLFLSFVTTFGICSDTSISEALFPFALAADPSFENHVFIALTLALLQFPLYGVLLGFAWKTWAGRLTFLGCIILLLGTHVGAVRLANHRVAAMWQYRFSHMR